MKEVRGRMSSKGANNAEQVSSSQSLPVDDEKIVQQNEGVSSEVEKKQGEVVCELNLEKNADDLQLASAESSAHPRDVKTESAHQDLDANESTLE